MTFGKISDRQVGRTTTESSTSLPVHHRKYLPSVWVTRPSIRLSSNRKYCFLTGVTFLQNGHTLVALLNFAFWNASAVAYRIPILNHLLQFWQCV